MVEPYTSRKTFRSPLSRDECLRRLHEHTIGFASFRGLWLGGWRPLAINHHVLRKAKGPQFRLQMVAIPPGGTAAWELRGQLCQQGKGTRIECSLNLRTGVRFLLVYLIALAVFMVGFAVYHTTVNGLSIQLLVIVAMLALPAVMLRRLIATPPRTIRRSLESELYAAVQQLFEASETRPHAG